VDGDPVPLLPGDRFIARGFSRTQGTGGTLGGGVILDVAPPHRRRSEPAVLRELEVFAGGDAAAALHERVVRTGMAGVEEGALRRETGHRREELNALLDKLIERALVVRAGAQCWIGIDSVRRMEEQLEAALDAFHAADPIRPGMTRAALRGQLPSNVRPEASELALTRLEADGKIVFADELVHRHDFTPTLDPEAEVAVKRIREEAAAAGLEPANPREWASELGVSLERFRDLVAYLERESVLVRAPGDLWFDRAAVDELCERVVAHMREHRELDTPTYKALIATTRRTAMPLMELLDELHVTRRSGDVRILRGGS
jgi:selenocysteine-specific elongation factor